MYRVKMDVNNSLSDGTCIIEDGNITCIGITSESIYSKIASFDEINGDEINGEYLAVTDHSAFSNNLAISGSVALGTDLVVSGSVITNKITLNTLDLQTILDAILLKIGGI
jgi:hypothetical protein